MKVLIIEEEIYLAQSISSKLSEAGYICDIKMTLKEALDSQEKYDVVLLSTSIAGQDFHPIINAYKHSIIILMITYISHDTVSKPIQAGVSDYILKPFMIEELIRKIKHFEKFNRIISENQNYQKYLNYTFSSVPPIDEMLVLSNNENLNIKIPILIYTNFQKYADAFAFNYAKTQNKQLFIIDHNDIKSNNFINLLKSNKSKNIFYLTDFQNMVLKDKQYVLSLMENKNIIISTTNAIETEELNIEKFTFLELKSEHQMFEKGEILKISDYIKYVLKNHQQELPDTELSKRLGISRKSLWEKRKKYGIYKKKK
jgi:DNA-binding NtrC family response regulator